MLLFLVVFSLLQWGWSACRDTWLERLVLHQATVVPAAALIRTLTPEIETLAAGASIKAPGGGLNILNGCEGTEILFLLVAALCAVRLGRRERLIGLGLGMLLVFVLNQARILALFYAYRSDRALFDALHNTVLPVVLVMLVTLAFYVFLHRHGRRLA